MQVHSVKHQRGVCVLLAIALIAYTLQLLLYGPPVVRGVIVDGDKKKQLLATKNQSDEKVMIDKFNTRTCGISDPNYDEHEFVNMARAGEFPWMVSFQIVIPKGVNVTTSDDLSSMSKMTKEDIGKSNREDLHFCGGAFISDKWVLSAAHCFAPDTIKNYLETNKLKAVAGSHRVSSRAPANRNLTIHRIYYHSRFDKSMPVGFDLALVELASPVAFTQKRPKSAGEGREQTEPFINTACLPLKDKKYDADQTARVAGWGLSSEKDGSSMPSKLLFTDIKLADRKKCMDDYVKALKSDKPRELQNKYDDVICASYKNTRDACQSDSGGPLMQYASGKAVVIGVVSYGIGCAKKGVPGLYTRVSAYINWIKDITQHGKDSTVGFTLLEAKNADGSSQVTSESDKQVAKMKHKSEAATTTLPPDQPPSTEKSTEEPNKDDTSKSEASGDNDGTTAKPLSANDEGADKDDNDAQVIKPHHLSTTTTKGPKIVGGPSTTSIPGARKTTTSKSTSEPETTQDSDATTIRPKNDAESTSKPTKGTTSKPAGQSDESKPASTSRKPKLSTRAPLVFEFYDGQTVS